MRQPSVQPTGTPLFPPALRHALPALLLLVVVVCLTGCGETKAVRVLLVGGAGLSQLGELGETIWAQCPDAEVVETGGWDGFRANVTRIAKEHPEQSIILIGHSLGCQTIALAAADLPNVDFIVMIDPAWDDITLPRAIRCLWFQRSEEGVERRALIRNGGRPIVISGSHNGICHDPGLISQVADIVASISQSRANQQRTRNANAR